MPPCLKSSSLLLAFHTSLHSHARAFTGEPSVPDPGVATRPVQSQKLKALSKAGSVPFIASMVKLPQHEVAMVALRWPAAAVDDVGIEHDHGSFRGGEALSLVPIRLELRDPRAR